MPLSTEEAAVTRAVAKELDGTDRLLIHGRVIPNVNGDIDRMAALAGNWNIAAWKTYTQFGTGWWLDDEKIGDPFFAKARETGNRLICIHKGLPLTPMGVENYRFSRCDDVGRAAAKHPDFHLVIYHSGFDPAIEETAFVPRSGKGGVDSLIQSMLDAGIGPNANVYAELGSTWRYLMGKPEQAAHAIGKLLKYVGEDNILWGTDSIWYGSPQDQIQAFRTFQISEEFQDRYGYPALTPEIRAKIFGLSSAKLYGVDVDHFKSGAKVDTIAQKRAEYGNEPDPSFLTYGPKTRQEFLALLRS